jgi:hypothetical protein
MSTILPVSQKQLDQGVNKLIDMIDKVKTEKDFTRMLSFSTIVLAQLRVKNLHCTAVTLLDDIYEKFNMIGK